MTGEELDWQAVFAAFGADGAPAITDAGPAITVTGLVPRHVTRHVTPYEVSCDGVRVSRCRWGDVLLTLDDNKHIGLSAAQWRALVRVVEEQEADRGR